MVRILARIYKIILLLSVTYMQNLMLMELRIEVGENDVQTFRNIQTFLVEIVDHNEEFDEWTKP